MSTTTDAPPTIGSIETIEIGKLIPTPDNPRFEVSAEAVADLAASIRANGLLQPVLARPHPTRKGCYDLRAGHRRLMAAKVAGLKAIPVVVRTLTDAEAMQVTITENLQREDLHPLEEAIGLKKLIDQGVSQAEAARLLGKSERWVGRRLLLAALTPAWIEAIKDDDAEARRLSGEALEEIARLGPQAQDDLLEQGFNESGTPTADQVRNEIARELRSVKAAPWDINDEELVAKAGSCIDCPHRTSRQPGLFDPPKVGKGPGSTADLCLDPVCWKAKETAFVQVRIAECKQAVKGLTVTAEYAYGLAPPLKKVYEKLQGRLDKYNSEAAKEGAAGAVPVLHLDGAKIGKLEWRKATKHTGSRSASGAPKVSADEARRRKIARQTLTDTAASIEEAAESRTFRNCLLISPLIKVLIQVFGVEAAYQAIEVTAKIMKSGMKDPGRCAHEAVKSVLWNMSNALRPTMVDHFATQLELAAELDAMLGAAGVPLHYHDHLAKATQEHGGRTAGVAAAKKTATKKKVGKR